MVTKFDLYNIYQNLNIKSVKGKVLIFQSDDWGSQRMPDLKTFNKLIGLSDINIDACPYNRLDSLENDDDLDNLFNLLIKYKDQENHFPCFTFNMNLFNPNISKIKENSFRSYYEFNLEESYRFYDRGEVLSKIKKANEHGLVDVQYHGKQHLNVNEYMRLLNDNDVVRNAAEHGFFALSFENSVKIKTPYLATYHPMFKDQNNELDFKEGFDYFNCIFNKKPTSFVAPVYAFDKSLEDYAVSIGIKSFQGLLKNNIDLNLNKGKRKNNKSDRIYQIRNINFEPATNQNYDWYDKTLRGIEIAFALKRPAIISSHRLNYISSLDKKNSSSNLKLLSNILFKVLKKWPDVKFLNTKDLYV